MPRVDCLSIARSTALPCTVLLSQFTHHLTLLGKRQQRQSDGKQNNRAKRQRPMDTDQTADDTDGHTAEGAQTERRHREQSHQATAQMNRSLELDDRLSDGIKSEIQRATNKKQR